MARRASGSVHAAAPGGASVEATMLRRQLYLDNVKVILIAAIIAIHAVLGYSSLEWWSYTEVREVTLSLPVEVALFVVVAPFALVMIPLLFLAAGLLTRPSLERKGPRAFTRDRLIRLGVPFAVFVLLLWPLLIYTLYRALGDVHASPWAYAIGTTEENIDTGALWFVGVLLIFSLVYAAAFAVRHREAQAGEVRIGHLLALAAGVAVASFLVRLVFPVGSDKYIDLNLWEWPACAALFGLGIVASRKGWLTAVPDRLRRHCRAAALIAAGTFALAALYGAAIGGDFEDVWGGGWHWTSLVFVADESALTVFGSVWLLGAAQQHLAGQPQWSTPAVRRSAYLAFMLQGFVLIGLAVVLRPVPVPAEVKALIVAVGGVAGSFALGWLLISRVPGVSRVV